MTMTRLRAAQAIAGALALPSLARAASAADVPAVTAGILPIEPAFQPYYAEANGDLAKAGITIEVQTQPTGAAILQAMTSGTFDIGYSTITTLALAHAKGLPFVIIAPSAVIRKGVLQGGVVVAANSPIKGPRDLEGKTIAISGIGTLAEFVPRGWVDKNGGDSSTIKFVEVPFPAIGEAVASGRADAGWLNEPFFTMAIKKGQVRLLTDGDDVLGQVYLATAWCATAAWAKAHADLVGRFARAMEQSAVWADANPDKVVAIAAPKLKQDPQVLASVLRTDYTDKLVPAQIQPSIDIAAKYQKFAPFPAADLIFHG